MIYQAIKEPAKEKNKLRNRRTVWAINTEGFKGAHFAVFPPELVRLCLLAGSKPDSTMSWIPFWDLVPSLKPVLNTNVNV